VQRAKLAAIETEWEAEPPPASFTLFGFPDEDTMTTHYAVKAPWVMGMIATRSINEKVDSIKEIRERKHRRIERSPTSGHKPWKRFPSATN
jgi:cytochrome d ubiquinol oxidase subunit I